MLRLAKLRWRDPSAEPSLALRQGIPAMPRPSTLTSMAPSGIFRRVSRPVTKEEFLQRCRQHYGDRYDYSHVEWIDTRHKILIVCPAHGPFEQFAYKHMRGHGCRRCTQQRRYAADRTNFVRIEAAIHARFP